MKRLLRWLAGLAALVALAVLAGAVWQRVATTRDEARFPMPGTRVDIGGRALHLHCSGQGQPTVVLENGLTANYAAWLLVQGPIASFTRVCSYDRAGMGWSDPSPDPTQAEFVERDLARLVESAHLPPPYVLVGWSAGGVFVRRFQREHAADVAGVVLVDSSHEQQASRLPKPPGGDLDAFVRGQLQLCSRIAWTGVVRLSGALAEMNTRLSLPESLRAELLALANRTEYCDGVRREMAGFPADLVAQTPPASLGDLPLAVLSRGRPSVPADFGGADVPADFLAEQDRVWASLQAELAALSSRTLHRTLPASGHAIPLEAPDAVVEAVRDVLQMARSTRARVPSAAASQTPLPSS
jgi:pimeloyl-ACP methyl ester carboxylesterase